MKKLIIASTMVVLLAAAVFGGQAIASNKPADSAVSEETSSIFGSSYWGSPLRVKTFEGCFKAGDYPDGYKGSILDETYPGIRHVSVTIVANGFDYAGNDVAGILLNSCDGSSVASINSDSQWDWNEAHIETFEFNANRWYIWLNTTKDSTAGYSYAVTVTYPSNQW
jgi:hypothetical protein